MNLEVVFLDANPVLNSNYPEKETERNLFLQTSIRNIVGVKKFLVTNSTESRLLDSGILNKVDEINFVIPFGPTRGALASALLPIDSLSNSCPIILVPTNSITNPLVVKTFLKKMQDDGNAAGTMLIESDNPHYSYARVYEGKVIEIIEKCVVGHFATTGIFYFRDKQMLKECARWAFVNNQSTNGNFYIAPSLNYVLSTGEDIGFQIVDSGSYQHLTW
jgi:hypothetical protein